VRVGWNSVRAAACSPDTAYYSSVITMITRSNKHQLIMNSKIEFKIGQIPPFSYTNYRNLFQDSRNLELNSKWTPSDDKFCLAFNIYVIFPV